MRKERDSRERLEREECSRLSRPSKRLSGKLFISLCASLIYQDFVLTANLSVREE